MRDMLSELYEALRAKEELADICIKSFERPETLASDEPSIVIIPLGPPIRVADGSDTSLAKAFLYQVNVEAKNRVTCKVLQGVVESVMEDKSFYQVAGGLDEYLKEIRRYVDARTYKGYSKLYERY